MKKNITIIAISIFTIFLISSCQEAGHIEEAPKDFISIHGKIYKIMRVVPCKGCRAIWIMYPKDSADSMPESINYEVKSGKNYHNEAVIIVK